MPILARRFPPELGCSRTWLPGLAQPLATTALADRNLTLAAYSSRRWLERDMAIPLATLAELEPGAPALIRVEAFDPILQYRYGALDLTLARNPSARAMEVLRGALAVIDRVPDLSESIAWLVRSVHIIEASGPGYDVSHSDPELPFSIFLSVPAGEPHAPLRAAESIVHEAMHLQLTLIEAQISLVAPIAGQELHSPWRNEPRPAGGLLHGLYVFAVIDAFLATLMPLLDSPDQAFAAKRRLEIAGEIADVAPLADHTGLTATGRALACYLLSPKAP